MDDKSKRKGVPVRPGLILQLCYAPLLTTLLLVATYIVLTGKIPFTDLVIFPLLTPQIQAWVFMASFIVLPIVILGSIAWFVTLYRSWNELSLGTFQRLLLAVPALVIPMAMVLLSCGAVIGTFMFGDTLQVRGTMTYEGHTYHLVEVFSRDNPETGNYVLYACEERGIFCKVAVRTDAQIGDFVRMDSDGHRLKLVFNDGRETAELTYYPFLD